MIATKDRRDDLRRTLRLLRNQDYPNIELIVIDDGSTELLEPTVRDIWPQVRYIRHETNAGQCIRRSQGFEVASGAYILQLDDDASPVQRNSITRAVALAESKPRVAAIAFHIFNGEVLPEELPAGEGRYTHSFVGCGVLFRTEAIRRIGGYCSFFGNEWEEEELSLRIMNTGYGLYFLPDVTIHHHLSVRNRVTDRTWMRGLRNKMWAQVMHCPAPRLFAELAWVSFVGALDAIRLLRIRRYAEGMIGFLKGLPRALKLRDPLSSLAMRRYDAARLLSALTDDNFDDPPRLRPAHVLRWFANWRNRPRQRSFWDRRESDLGECATVAFAHEYDTQETGGK
jgi:GT2 family glycosyltransferase